MAEYRVRFAGKAARIDDVDWCVWCYEISYDGDGKPFKGEDGWGIDVPKELVILPLDDLSKEVREAIPDSLRKDIGSVHRTPDPDGRPVVFRKIDPPTDKARLCFISRCESAKGLVPISLEQRTPTGWVPVPGNDGEPIRPKLPGPA